MLWGGLEEYSMIDILSCSYYHWVTVESVRAIFESLFFS
jgi:hypothetical protein